MPAGSQPSHERTPTSAKRQQTRERLMDAAYKLFAEVGVHATSIEAIAEEAAFTRGAFYSNFASKTELFFALAQREWDIRLDVVRSVVKEFAANASPQSLQQRVSTLVVEVFTALPDDRKWALIYREFELLALRDPTIARQYVEHEKEFQTQLRKVLQDAAEFFNLEFSLDAGAVAQIIALIHQRAVEVAILSGTDDVATATRDELLRSLPPLLDVITTTRP
ncbi:MAG TPA: helix-turn-helix domain-containing protein [Beutenbergiaceae bacterium]|nr:helix-turn-helix domain-containing protein [Beutenbergiaceae bacterium]